eukprot:maker-scaffold264_size232020-snap-gene-0.9 protein:Tk03476 transcript:maker-scaffold264_size232020-snap-gene-0.9-mRNA-1 annotation:"iduronate 2-sulfatase"
MLPQNSLDLTIMSCLIFSNSSQVEEKKGSLKKGSRLVILVLHEQAHIGRQTGSDEDFHDLKHGHQKYGGIVGPLTYLMFEEVHQEVGEMSITFALGQLVHAMESLKKHEAMPLRAISGRWKWEKRPNRREGPTIVGKKSEKKTNPSSGGGSNQEHFISGLLQQIKLLELEISYLKNHSQRPDRKPTVDQQSLRRKSSADLDPVSLPGSSNSLKEDNSRLQTEIKKLKTDLVDRNNRLEEALMATAAQRRDKANSRLGLMEEEDEKSRLLDQIARLTGQTEQLEIDRRNLADRHQKTLEELERQTIVSKDREKRIHSLMEDMEMRDETVQNMKLETDVLRGDLLQREGQNNDLHEKFLQSSQHILEETLRGLRDENKALQHKLKILEVKDDEHQEKLSHLNTKNDNLVAENAELRSEMAETKQKLESEVRVRETRDAKFLLDSQEAFSGKEKEKSLKQELNRMQLELEREKSKAKNALDKNAREMQQITSLELRITTQKSRIAELEGSLVLAQESTNKIRKESLVHQEKIKQLVKEVEHKSLDLRNLLARLTGTENRLADSERRVESLANVNSQRWVEFAKMADNMKELSTNMLSQTYLCFVTSATTMTDTEATLNTIKAHKGHLTRLSTKIVKLCDFMAGTPSPESSLQATQSLAAFNERVDTIQNAYTALQIANQGDDTVYATRLDELADEQNRINFMVLAALATASTPATPPSSMPTVGRQPRPIEALRPTTLTREFTPTEFRSWTARFKAYFSSSGLDKCSIPEQHAYLNMCLDTDLEAKIHLRMDNATPVFGETKECCFSFLQEEFLLAYPISSRRHNFFSAKQSHGQTFMDFSTQLRKMGEEADLASLSVEDIFAIVNVVDIQDINQTMALHSQWDQLDRQGSKPNVLFLMVDDLKADAIGAYGDPVAITPNMDWLASKSTVFKHAYVQQALCAPSPREIGFRSTFALLEHLTNGMSVISFFFEELGQRFESVNVVDIQDINQTMALHSQWDQLDRQGSKPNVLFLMVDDLKADAIGAYGDPVAITPNMDWLASKSTVFKHAYVQQALCAPSRSSMLTSRRPDSLKSYDFVSFWRKVAGPFKTLPQFFKEKGYDTHAIGKVFQEGKSAPKSDFPRSWSRRPQTPKGQKYHAGKDRCTVNGKEVFNLFCPVKDSPKLHDNQLRDFAISYLKKAKKRNKPFFLAVGFYRPHKPYKLVDEYLNIYPSSMKVASNGRVPKDMPPIAYNPIKFNKHPEIKSLQLKFPIDYIPDTMQQKMRQYYYASMSWTDDNIGKVLEALLQNGFADNTIVNLVVDHGYQLGEHGIYGKHTNFEEGVRVPWMVFDPKKDGSLRSFKPVSPLKLRKPSQLQPKRFISTMVEALDVYPTLVEMAGLGSMPACNGHDRRKSFCTQGTSRLSVQTNDKNAYAVSQYPRPSTKIQWDSQSPRLQFINFMGYSARYQDIRYTWWVPFDNKAIKPNFDTTIAEELYDYSKDPGGDFNVASDNKYAKLIRKLREMIKTKIPA